MLMSDCIWPDFLSVDRDLLLIHYASMPPSQNKGWGSKVLKHPLNLGQYTVLEQGSYLFCNRY